jgi:hypothetical protein
MTASERCKQAGLSGLQELAEITGQSVQTLINWSKSEKKAQLFEIAVIGAATEKQREVSDCQHPAQDRNA